MAMESNPLRDKNAVGLSTSHVWTTHPKYLIGAPLRLQTIMLASSALSPWIFRFLKVQQQFEGAHGRPLPRGDLKECLFLNRYNMTACLQFFPLKTYHLWNGIYRWQMKGRWKIKWPGWGLFSPRLFYFRFGSWSLKGGVICTWHNLSTHHRAGYQCRVHFSQPL